MELHSYDLVASLQALPETDPVEVDGVQFGGGGGGKRTCSSRCKDLTVTVIQTVCLIVASCK